jgi:hypothetical protein
VIETRTTKETEVDEASEFDGRNEDDDERKIHPRCG